MKKILSLLATVGLVATSSLSVISCGKKSLPELDVENLIKEFKEEVNKIIRDHAAEYNKNFFLLDSEKNSNLLFLTKEKILNFLNGEEIKNSNDLIRKDLEKDFNTLFKTNIIKSKINNLKNKEKYQLILGNVDSVFKGIELSSNDKIFISSKNSSTTEEKIWFGTTKFDYSILINFSNKIGQIEEYKVTNMNTIISITDSEVVAGDIQEMYTKIDNTFLKNEISKIYSNNLLLLEKDYLHLNLNSEFQSYLNGQNYRKEFTNFISKEFRINLKLDGNNFNDFNQTMAYRNDYSIKQNHIEMQNFLKNKDTQISNLIKATENEVEKIADTDIKNNLDLISPSLYNDEELKSIIKSSLRMYKMKLGSIFYKIDEQNFVEIPDLYLNFWYTKNKEITSRNDFEKDIINNIIFTTEKYIEVFEVSTSSKKGWLFDFKSARIIDLWFENGLEAKTENMSEYSSFLKPELLDLRNKFLKESKQSIYELDITSTSTPTNDVFRARNSNIWGKKNTRVELGVFVPMFTIINCDITLKFDYLQILSETITFEWLSSAYLVLFGQQN
ncbi:lipoprotein [Spiroplasma endosymbiont of Dioctria linearis]|uniref:lipoprotein n=1 Tax=Spiroplasma endosymbiont of Dioctria linearis TaxID=3066290 RepID=UPI00313CFBC1